MLFVGNDWAEDHHDVEIVDEQGRRLARRRLPEGLDGVTRLHALIAQFFPEEWADLEPAEAASRVKVGIETERGPWVQALIAAGYEVFAINPMSVARYRERHSTSGAKSDAGDAHVLAEIVRWIGRITGRWPGTPSWVRRSSWWPASHQSLVWDRTRHVLRLRGVLREFFPAALEAFADLAAPDTLELLALAPDPDRAARLSKAEDHRGVAAGQPPRRRGESFRDPVGVAGPGVAATRPGPGGVRGDRRPARSGSSPR